MKALLSLELKKIFLNKKNLVCAVVLLVVALIFVGTYDSNRKKELEWDIQCDEWTFEYAKNTQKSEILSLKTGGYAFDYEKAQKQYDETVKTGEEKLEALKKDDGIGARKSEVPPALIMREGYCVDDSQTISDVDTYNYKLKTYPTVYERLNGRLFLDEVCATYIPFLFIIFLIFLSSESFSEEFHAGTNKFIYTQPVSITKIYFAKFLSVIIYALCAFLLVYGSIFLVLGLVRGFGTFDTQYVIDLRALTQFFKQNIIRQLALLMKNHCFYIQFLIIF